MEPGGEDGAANGDVVVIKLVEGVCIDVAMWVAFTVEAVVAIAVSAIEVSILSTVVVRVCNVTTTMFGAEAPVTSIVKVSVPSTLFTLAEIALPISTFVDSINALPTSTPVVVTTADASPGTLMA